MGIMSEAGVLTLPDVLRQRAMAELGDLERGALIGRGSFGRVYKGRWRGARPGRRAPGRALGCGLALGPAVLERDARAGRCLSGRARSRRAGHPAALRLCDLGP